MFNWQTPSSHTSFVCSFICSFVRLDKYKIDLGKDRFNDLVVYQHFCELIVSLVASKEEKF